MPLISRCHPDVCRRSYLCRRYKTASVEQRRPELPHDEEDNLISLEVGGAPRSTKNLWPEPREQARKSDPLENVWHKRVCNGTLTLRQAQKPELAYKRRHG